MRPFDYLRPATLDEALAAHHGPGAAYLAGGTSLVDLMKNHVAMPDRVIDIGGLPLAGIAIETGDGRPGGEVLRIGALARLSDVARHPDVPVLIADALRSGASPQLRNMATIGGNLLQRTRCGYFRDPRFPCNKRLPGSGCPAIEGDHRGHAVLGGSEHCVAAHPSDLTIALAALEAVVLLHGHAGRRRLPLTDFYRPPSDTPHQENLLVEGELIEAVELPLRPTGLRSRFLKVRDRASFQFAVVSVAVALRLEEGRVAEPRVALGGVATVPWRARAAEAVLDGARPDRGVLSRAAQEAVVGALPLPGNAGKVELTSRAVRRTLRELVS